MKNVCLGGNTQKKTPLAARSADLLKAEKVLEQTRFGALIGTDEMKKTSPPFFKHNGTTGRP